MEVSRADGGSCVRLQVEHLWQLVAISLVDGHGAPADYECIRPGCEAIASRSPGEPFPDSY